MGDFPFVGAALAVAGFATPFVILWLRHRALAERVVAPRQPSSHERIALRRRHRHGIVAFVLVTIVNVALILASAAVGAPGSPRTALIGVILALVIAGIAYHLSTRCPICRYRLGYQRALGVPARCERCGADFWWSNARVEAPRVGGAQAPGTSGAPQDSGGPADPPPG